MAVVVSVADPSPRSAETPAAVERFDDIIVVGGGCYGGYYLRQLERAARAGAIGASRVVVVDRDPECAVARTVRVPSEEPWPIAVELRQEEWSAFFQRYLTDAARDRSGARHDAIVPSPLMPHLMAEWLVTRARERWPARPIVTRPLDRAPRLPWERAGEDGTHYVSFADWICPVNCIEPRTCPHTRAARDWSLPVWLDAFVADEHARAGTPMAGVALHCRHRAYGVGMFDTAEVMAADDTIARTGDRGAAEVFIGTMSHCHGALTRLVIGPGSAAPGSPRTLDF